MKRFGSPLLGVAIAALIGSGQVQGASDRKVEVTVPPSVSAQAAARLSGDASAPAPVLVLDGVELGQGEGIAIRVLGAPEGPVLGSAATVGQRQSRPAGPMVRQTLIVPLNDRSLELIAGKSSIVLFLRVESAPERPPLEIDRIYFREK